MVEVNGAPHVHAVAAFAALIFIIALVQVWVVYIFMAINAGFAHIGKVPFLTGFMAGNTGCGQMSTFQRKIRFVMFLYGKGGFFKAIHIMAFCTIVGCAVFCELPLVIIFMAIAATAVFDGGSVIILMTRPAIQEAVFALQFESCFAVVELINAFYFKEGFFGMAALTVLSEFVVMNIGVAIGAAIMVNTGKFMEFFSATGGHLMAVIAFHFAVFAF